MEVRFEYIDSDFKETDRILREAINNRRQEIFNCFKVDACKLQPDENTSKALTALQADEHLKQLNRMLVDLIMMQMPVMIIKE